MALGKVALHDEFFHVDCVRPFNELVLGLLGQVSQAVQILDAHDLMVIFEAIAVVDQAGGLPELLLNLLIDLVG